MVHNVHVNTVNIIAGSLQVLLIRQCAKPLNGFTAGRSIQENKFSHPFKKLKMAKQDGILPLKGNIDNISFYKTKDGGYQARKKGGVERTRLLNDPNYKRTREHMAEFGNATKGAKLLRQALLKAVIGSTDSKVSNRLSAALVSITRKDTENVRGERIFSHDGLVALKGFNFNEASKLDTVVLAQISTGIERVTGVCNVSIPAYVPEEQIKFSAEATHYRFRIVAAAINFETGEYEMQTDVSPYKVLGLLEETTEQTLSVTLTPNSLHPIVLALTVEFVQETEQGTMYPLKNGSMNPCRIEAVDVAA
jgi:hypothetical protein